MSHIIAVVVAAECVKLNQLFILPEHQGKGVGRECMLLIMEEASRLGLPVRLRVLKVNPRALAFFQRFGFLRTGETETHGNSPLYELILAGCGVIRYTFAHEGSGEGTSRTRSTD